jgi:hypothetical protein
MRRAEATLLGRWAPSEYRVYPEDVKRVMRSEVEVRVEQGICSAIVASDRAVLCIEHFTYFEDRSARIVHIGRLHPQSISIRVRLKFKTVEFWPCLVALHELPGWKKFRQ